MNLPVLEVDVPVYALLSVIALILLHWYGTSTFDTFKREGTPYLTPLIPCLGNLLSFFIRPLHENDVLNSARFPGKIYGAFQCRLPVLEVADAIFLKQIMIKEFTKFSNRRNFFEGDESILTANVLALTDDHWKHVRSQITPTFTSGKLKQMLPLIETCADKLVDHLRSQSTAPVTIKDYTAAYTMDVIASTGFGMDIDTQRNTNHPFVVTAGTFFGIPKDKSLYAKCRGIIAIFVLMAFPAFIRRLLDSMFNFGFVDKDSVDYFEAIVKKVLSEQREQLLRNNNFISMCSDKLVNIDSVNTSTVRVTKGRKWFTQGLTETEILGNAIMFLIVGYETTATALQYFFYNMAKHPEIQDMLFLSIMNVKGEEEKENSSYEVYTNLDYLEWCIKESLRIFPPVVRNDRVANEDVTINGIYIPKGRVVNGLIYAIHHDPEYWPDPELYRPERFSPENLTETQNAAYLPFGGGSRTCIAMRLALLEIRVAVVKALTAFRFEMTPKTPNTLKFKIGTGTLMTKEPLMISAVPRSI